MNKIKIDQLSKLLVGLGVILFGIAFFYRYAGEPLWNKWQLNKCLTEIQKRKEQAPKRSISLYDAYKESVQAGGDTTYISEGDCYNQYK